MTVLFIYHCFYFLQLVAVLKTLQLHPPAVDYYISIFVTINLLFQKIFILRPHPPEGFFFGLNPPPISKLQFFFRLSVKQISLSIVSGNTILFALLLKLGVVKLYSKIQFLQNFLIIEYKKITNFRLSRCHYFFSIYLTK